MVPLPDLPMSGRRIGIKGGPLDVGWLSSRCSHRRNDAGAGRSIEGTRERCAREVLLDLIILTFALLGIAGYGLPSIGEMCPST